MVVVDLADMYDRSDEVIIKEFGANLRRVRENKGLSLRELAHRADIATNTVNRIEQGITDTSMTTIVRIAEALGVDPGELFVPLR